MSKKLLLDKHLNSMLLLASQTIDIRDTYTGFHSYNTAIYAALIAKQLGMNKKEIRKIFVALLLHDNSELQLLKATCKNKPLKSGALVCFQLFTFQSNALCDHLYQGEMQRA